jgi:shikimate kinase
MDNIILIGFMGCGKTSVGLKLAKKLRYNFCDTDQMIEKECKRSISNIFATEGEEYFRNLETASIKKLIGVLRHSVISVGGGLPIREGNGELLRELGHVIYLKTTKETIIKRLKGDTTRPLLAGDDVDLKLNNLFTYRSPIYESVSHNIIETDKKNIDHIINNIINIVNNTNG